MVTLKVADKLELLVRLNLVICNESMENFREFRLEDKVQSSGNESDDKNKEQEKREGPAEESAATASSLFGWFSVDDRNCTLKRGIVNMCSWITLIRGGGAPGAPMEPSEPAVPQHHGYYSY
ncbi:hypothetical protein OIU78_016347 [Salix suchowensis]|nr:hypothetical protein OIU78_016347 [Salix suchowensis]